MDQRIPTRSISEYLTFVAVLGRHKLPRSGGGPGRHPQVVLHVDGEEAEGVLEPS